MMEWYWVMIIVVGVLVLYVLSGIVSLRLVKDLGITARSYNGDFHTYFYFGPLALFYLVPLYIAKRIGHDISL